LAYTLRVVYVFSYFFFQKIAHTYVLPKEHTPTFRKIKKVCINTPVDNPPTPNMAHVMLAHTRVGGAFAVKFPSWEGWTCAKHMDGVVVCPAWRTCHTCTCRQLHEYGKSVINRNK
jgi:hypothetical protein